MTWTDDTLWKRILSKDIDDAIHKVATAAYKRYKNYTLSDIEDAVNDLRVYLFTKLQKCDPGITDKEIEYIVVGQYQYVYSKVPKTLYQVRHAEEFQLNKMIMQKKREENE